MPLLDHFHPPLQKTWTWESFHATWAVELAGMLNDGLLPPSFVALPLTQVGTRIEIDVATLNGSGEVVPPQGAGGVATIPAVWAPPHPILDASIDFTHLDLFEVQIRREDDSPDWPPLSNWSVPATRTANPTAAPSPSSAPTTCRRA